MTEINLYIRCFKKLLYTLLKTKYALHTKIGVNWVFTPCIPYHGVDITPMVCITYYTMWYVLHTPYKVCLAYHMVCITSLQPHM